MARYSDYPVPRGSPGTQHHTSEVMAGYPTPPLVCRGLLLSPLSMKIITLKQHKIGDSKRSRSML